MMGFDLYRKMAETDGAYAGDGPARRGLLQRAAAEAADFWLPRLLPAQQARLGRFLLHPSQVTSPDRAKLLRRSLVIWCEARWDGAAPYPADAESAILLETIARNRELLSEKPDPIWKDLLFLVVYAGLVVVFVAMAEAVDWVKHFFAM